MTFYVPYGLPFWSDGTYWDTRQGLAALSGAPISIVNGHIDDPVGIGGQYAPLFTSSALQYLACNALAGLMAGSDKPFTGIFRVRRDRPVSSAIFGFGNTAQSTDDFFDADFTGGYASPRMRKDAVGEAVKTVVGGTIDWRDHIVACVTDGKVGRVYVDSQLWASGDIDTAALGVNRFLIGASPRVGILNYFSGWIQLAAVTAKVLTRAQIQYVSSVWRRQDNVRGGRRFTWFGDSITQGDTDIVNGVVRGGFRQRVYEWQREQLLTGVNSVGPFIQGYFPDHQHTAQGGQTIQGVGTLATNNIGAGKPYQKVYLANVMAGTNDMVTYSGVTLTRYATMLNNIHTALTSDVPEARFGVTTIPAIEPSAGGAANVVPFNSAIQGLWDNFDAAHPNNRLIRWDAYTALGGYNPALYQDASHPNAAGYDVLGAAVIAALGPHLRQLSN